MVRVARVEFYRGTSTLIGTDTTSPYTFNWTGAAVGSYSVTAVALRHERCEHHVGATVTITVGAADGAAERRGFHGVTTITRQT